MPRKTIHIDAMLGRLNYFLANSPQEKQRERRELANFVESLLLDAENYGGFSYLDSAGLMREEGDLVDILDDTRRYYRAKRI